MNKKKKMIVTTNVEWIAKTKLKGIDVTVNLNKAGQLIIEIKQAQSEV